MSGYIGAQPVPQATQHRQAFTATAAQTSFPTAGYTPQFVDVYLNGVKLAAADYTATNGSDIVLTTGAALNDILEYVAYTPFEVANQTFTGTTTTDVLTTTGAFTSLGIDDNAAATAVTIDASGNVQMTGDVTAGDITVADADEANVRWESAGVAHTTSFARDSDGHFGLYDAENLRTFFRHVKNATSAGQTLRLLETGGNVGIGDTSPSEALSVTGNIAATGTIETTGGIYLGGTGAANKLDDYEVGLHSPTVTATAGAINLSTASDNLRYVKIGSLVHVWGRLDVSSVSSPSGRIEVTLPFAVENAWEDSNAGAALCYINNSVSLTVGDFAGLVVEASSYMRLYISTVSALSSAAANAQQIKAGSSIWIDAKYTTT